MKDMKICSNCVLNTSDPDIKFDENGVCNYCHNFQDKLKSDLYGEKERNLLIQEIKKYGKGKKYDCLIGLSGGVDSSITAVLVANLGLRTLAISVDNTWNAPKADETIMNLVERLGLEFRRVVLAGDEFRALQRALIKSSTPNVELATDHILGAVMARTAVKEGIKYIITGANLVTEGIMPEAWGCSEGP